MSADRVGPRPRPDSVAPADVDPVLWEMSSELVDLRRQLSELRQSLAERERRLGETRRGSDVSERAVATLKGVLTDMVLKARTELAAAREEAMRTMTARVAAAQAEADGLVADATAALSIVLGRPASAGATSPRPVEMPPPVAQPWPTDATPPPRLPETPWPVGWVPPTDLSAPPSPPQPGPFDAGPSDPPPPAAEDVPAHLNGWGSAPSAVQTLVPELDRQFEQVVGLPPNTEFRTPPRGTPVVPPAPVHEVTATTATTAASPPPAPPRPADPPPGPADAPPAPAPTADTAFDEFWPFAGAPGAATAGRLPFGLLDALLPIIAVTLVVIVVLSWLG